jgi:hypothetical protein
LESSDSVVDYTTGPILEDQYLFKSSNSIVVNSLKFVNISMYIPYFVTIDANNFSVIGGSMCSYNESIVNDQYKRSCADSYTLLDSKGIFKLINNTNFLLDGAIQADWDNNTIPDVAYISTIEELHLGNNSKFTLKSYLELDNLYLVENDDNDDFIPDLTVDEIQNNNSSLIIDGGFLNILEINSPANQVNNLFLQNGILFSNSSLTIYSDLTMKDESRIYISYGSLVFDNQKLNSEHNINIELTKFNKNYYAIEVNHGSIQLADGMHINVYVDSSTLLQIGNEYTYKLI